MKEKETLMDYPYPQYRRVAFGKVVFLGGKVLKRRIVVFSDSGNPIAHFPLNAEEPFVEWNTGTYDYNIR